MIYDPIKDDLKSLSFDIEADRLEMIEDTKGFERVFNFPESAVVHFSKKMGVSGFAFENDAVNYFNGLSNKTQSKTVSEYISTCFAIGQKRIPQDVRNILHQSLTESHPYNSKIDNLLETN